MTTYIYRSILFLIAVFIYLLNFTPVYAVDPPVTVSVSINSGAPSIDLTENTTTSVVVATTVSDATGCGDIIGVTVKFYKTSTGAGASDDPNNHYTVTTPSDVVQNSCVGLLATYTATIPVQYYADPAEWTAEVTATDGTPGTPGTDTITINTLTALNVTTPVAYGPFVLGTDTGTSDQTSTVTNTGNVAIGTQVDGYGSVNGDGKSLICTFGSIPIGNERYSLTPATSYASKTWLTDISTTIPTFSIAKATSGTPSTGNVYWGFGMPLNGVGGSCTGTIVFTAI